MGTNRFRDRFETPLFGAACHDSLMSRLRGNSQGGAVRLPLQRAGRTAFFMRWCFFCAGGFGRPGWEAAMWARWRPGEGQVQPACWLVPVTAPAPERKVAYRVLSMMPAEANARCRSAHLLQQPQ